MAVRDARAQEMRSGAWFTCLGLGLQQADRSEKDLTLRLPDTDLRSFPICVRNLNILRYTRRRLVGRSLERGALGK